MNDLKIVLRIGGSILGSPPDAGIVRGYSKTISKILQRKHDVVIVVGGGKIAREYINIAKEMGLSHEMQDSIAIQASRLNARVVGMSIGVDSVNDSLQSAITTANKKHVAVMGGLKPGITTDTVAALVASSWKSDLLVKASDQQGIYTADPRLDPNAEFLPTVSYKRIAEILGGEHSPGIHSIVDPVAVQIIARKKMRLAVVKGDHPDNVLRVIRGENVGTIVS
jgi:uridylate kinase